MRKKIWDVITTILWAPVGLALGVVFMLFALVYRIFADIPDDIKFFKKTVKDVKAAVFSKKTEQ